MVIFVCVKLGSDMWSNCSLLCCEVEVQVFELVWVKCLCVVLVYVDDGVIVYDEVIGIIFGVCLCWGLGC